MKSMLGDAHVILDATPTSFIPITGVRIRMPQDSAEVSGGHLNHVLQPLPHRLEEGIALVW